MTSFTPMERADAYLQAGELDDALDALNDQLADHPDDQHARRLRAQVLLRLHTPDHWRAALAEWAVLDVLTVDDVIHQHTAHLKLGDADGAHRRLIDHAARGGEIGADARVIELLLESHYQRGEAAEGIERLFDLPKTWRWLRWNGDFHALKGDHRVALNYYCSALDSLDESTQDAPKSALGFIGNLRAQILLRRAPMFERLGLYAEAAADYADAQTSAPGDPIIVFKRGMMLCLSGDVEGAIRVCRDVLAHADDGTRAMLTALLADDARYSALIGALD
jgi:tetratricopeptide (TPR) repeat protein